MCIYTLDLRTNITKPLYRRVLKSILWHWHLQTVHMKPLQAVTTLNQVMIWQVNICKCSRWGMILCTWSWRLILASSSVLERKSVSLNENSQRCRLISDCLNVMTPGWTLLTRDVAVAIANRPVTHTCEPACLWCSLWSPFDQYEEVWQSAFVRWCRLKGKGYHTPLLLHCSLLQCQPMPKSIVHNLDKFSWYFPESHSLR